jgi:hypothetical protein
MYSPKAEMPPLAGLLAFESATDLNPQAAYTYFGQFIMHDLTYDDTAFRAAAEKNPEDTINHRTPRLDLDSVYGDGPFSPRHHHLYKGVSFRLGDIKNRNNAQFDLPLVNDLPILADERNCENAIMRQIHVMFMKLHNLAVRNLDDGIIGDKELFETARNLVRWQFQWLVREDFLAKVCDPDVYEAVVRKDERLIHWPQGSFSIPVEFSQAAARFGHSMVKENYTLTDNGPSISLDALFIGKDRKGALLPEHAVEWAHFMRIKTSAQDIDTRLANQLSNVPDQSIDPFVTSPMPHEPHMLALRTLCRGAATKLPTGQQVRVALQPNATLAVPENDPAWQRLKDAWAELNKLGFDNETPLWYYILLEAEIIGSHVRLGVVGSRLVAEVIVASLLHDQQSFLFQAGGAWKPSAWNFDGKQRLIKNLYHLAVVVGLEPEKVQP